MTSQQKQHCPQGIRSEHSRQSLLTRFPNLLSLLFWSAIMLAAAIGTFGGQPHPVMTARADAASLKIGAPRRIRNGEFFEIRADVAAIQPIDDAILEISQGYFKDLTINTMIPAPEKEEALDGKFRFSFGPLKPGETLHVKIDGQINPPLVAGTQGNIALYDGERRITVIPVKMQVWP